mmetsp:Transcript_2586/g.3680  ORF Transcript_2586/g.3680 Transcript_2586/m.3680 type:complete len:108 (+) Transcript_2586:60-383(+)|eukprot:CAMPEP_0117754440 /NCGR_PEP_ID=MMETSP0947-20121206/12834_1 /TAXON_ID=44440 /ORGANISM="Chattonella subsalsa, Strain CCMP2191" /LENGTH=107 /DNA_ID=CAMNT_0005573537 /DNA_START=55 /DNA_END=378 /DNA_ORIENTATION=+
MALRRSLATSGPVRRSFAAMFAAERNDIQPQLKKWWKGQAKMDGVVTKSLSPFEQQIVTPWLKTIPDKLKKKFMDDFPPMIPAIVFTGIVLGYVKVEKDRLAMEHRD